MKNILSIQGAAKSAGELRSQGRKIVLVGGCFDILHIGHITFLESAKNLGDVLFVLVESDEAITKIKGLNRPINTQSDRAKILSALRSVDFVVPLKYFKNDAMYDEVILSIKPAIIATTKGDLEIMHKIRQAKQIGANVVQSTNLLENQSTSRLVKLLKDTKL